MEHILGNSRGVHINVCILHNTLFLSRISFSLATILMRAFITRTNNMAPRRHPEREQEQWNKFGEL